MAVSHTTGEKTKKARTVSRPGNLPRFVPGIMSLRQPLAKRNALGRQAAKRRMAEAMRLETAAPPD
jgi:hypothetical protein